MANHTVVSAHAAASVRQTAQTAQMAERQVE